MRGEQEKQSGDKFFLVLLAVACLVFLAKLNIANLYQINWDEFFFLSKVYDYLRGGLGQALQTFHVHFFTWLPLVSDNEAKQIVAARFVMVVFQGLSGLCIYRIARHFFQRSSSLFAALAYFSVNYVLLLGADFRSDPIAGFFSIAAIDLLLNMRRGWGYAVGAAVSSAIALMITIKASFYLPVLGLIYLITVWNSGNKIRMLSQGVAATVVGVVAVGTLYWFHLSSIGGVSEPSGTIVESSYQKTITSQTFFPRWQFFAESLKKDVLFWVLWAVGFVMIAWEWVSQQRLDRIQSSILLVMGLPITTFLFYRNAFPYYYAFILMTPSVLIGMVWERLALEDMSLLKITARMLLAVVVVIVLYSGFVTPFKKNMHAQEQMLSVIHELFPSPVSYIDRCSMVSTYKKEGFFMSTWGTENYRAQGKPIFEKIIEKEQPKFLLANKQQLNIRIPDDLRQRIFHQDYDLLREDLKILRSNYIPHWGNLYVPGKYIEIEETQETYELTVMIEGDYTLEAQVAAVLNGKALSPGSTVYLKKGTHKFSSDQKGLYVFRWGDHLPVPTTKPLSNFLFYGF